jgi:hypothetical protein
MADRSRRFDREATPMPDGSGGVVTGEQDQAYANPTDAPPPATRADGTAVDQRAVPADRTAGATRTGNGIPRETRARTTGDAVVLDREARLRQRDEFGGINWGAAFFGWVVALGIGVLLTAIVAAAGAAIGLTDAANAQASSPALDTLDIVGGALLIAIALISYYAGGYVAGRMSRFDGARQGFGVWVVAVIVTLVLAAAGAILGDQYNVFDKLDLPRIPSNASDLTTGGVITLAAIVLGSLLAAVIGGKVGQRYHRRVDRAALDTDY